MSQMLTHEEVSSGGDLILAGEFARGPVLSLDELKGHERPIAPSSLYHPENIRMSFLFLISVCVCAISQEGDKHS